MSSFAISAATTAGHELPEPEVRISPHRHRNPDRLGELEVEYETGTPGEPALGLG